MGDYLLGILAMVIAGLVLLSPVACTMRQNELVAEAIKNGADPIAAKCALIDDWRSTVCIAYAGRGSK